MVTAVCGWRTTDAQVRLHSAAADLTITGQLQTQFNTTSAAGEPSSEYLVRRARITAEVRINDVVSGKVEPDFAMGTVRLKDAFVRLTLAPAFRLTMGQQKRPFDLFKLQAATEILVVERLGTIRGVDPCAGVGGICAFSQLTQELEYADRDIGVFVDGQDRAGNFTYAASVTNGTGDNASDENGTKSYTARVSARPLDGTRIAAHVGVHDYRDPIRGDEYATAFGADLEIGDFSPGLHLMAGVVSGDNWRNLTAEGPTPFFATQAIVAYRAPVRGGRPVAALEPVLRLSFGDPDRDTAADGGWLVTPGAFAYITGRNRLGVNLDIWKPQVGETEVSLKAQAYLHF
jgi:hypothetical protein